MMIIYMFTTQMAATTRNVFIANLALADLLLCLFTIPLTLIDLVNKYWGLAPGMVNYNRGSDLLRSDML